MVPQGFPTFFHGLTKVYWADPFIMFPGRFPKGFPKCCWWYCLGLSGIFFFFLLYFSCDVSLSNHRFCNSLLGCRHVKQRVEANELPWLLIVILCQSRPNARKSAAFFQSQPNPPRAIWRKGQMDQSPLTIRASQLGAN